MTNQEIELLSAEIKPLVDKMAKRHGIVFEPKSSELLSQFYENDETARYLFDAFVTVSTPDQSCGGFAITNTEQLEAIYADPPDRGNELIENRIFVFALEGDGSFFGFGLESRKFYNFDFSPWIGEEEPWNECVSEDWNTKQFCEYFIEQYELNIK